MDDLTPRAGFRNRIHDSILETVGATPLVRIPRLAAEEKLVADLCLKLEFFNPMASVKDRIALAMVRGAEAQGIITPGVSVLVEPTSGNTGIGLAFVAAALGYRLIVTMPERASVERRQMMRLLGAELVLTPSGEGMKGAIARAEQIAADTPHAWLPRQFDNPANPAVHAATTAEEIWADTGGEVDLIIGGLGTGGTMTGIARALKPRRAGLRCIGIEPAESAVLHGDDPGPHGIQGIGPGFKPAVLEVELLDAIDTATEQESLVAARRAARLDGVALGISSGAALAVGLRHAALPENAGRRIVCICASFAERYLSTALFQGLE